MPGSADTQRSLPAPKRIHVRLVLLLSLFAAVGFGLVSTTGPAFAAAANATEAEPAPKSIHLYGVVKQVLPATKAAGDGLPTIPAEGALEIEARLSPADRGRLFVNQQAQVTIVAYDSPVYGSFQGTVVAIGEGVTLDKRGEPWYEVRLLTKGKDLFYDGHELTIIPGMTVMVDVPLDAKSVLDSVLAPHERAGS